MFHSPFPIPSSPQSNHLDLHVAQNNQLAGADFAGFAQFDLAIDGHLAIADDHLGFAATGDQVGQLQQLLQFHVFTVQLEINALHGLHRGKCGRYCALMVRPSGRPSGWGVGAS